MQQLLQQVSWEGNRVALYRKGGLGLENVLTAEVLQGLDFLPRAHFLGAVVGSLNGECVEAKRLLRDSVETASISLLADQFFMRPGRDTHQTQTVNPDATIEAPGVYAFVEAKRIRASAFQIEQLAREFVVVTREAGVRVPLLLLILGKKPPVMVKGVGYRAIRTAIIDKLEAVLHKADSPFTHLELENMIDRVVAWTTWDEIVAVVKQQAATFASESDSVASTVQRLVSSVVSAVERHK